MQKNHLQNHLAGFLLAVIAAAFGSCGSGSDEPDVVVPQLTVAPATLTFGSGAGSQTFQVSCNGTWKLTVTGDWCTASPNSGAGSNGSHITVTVGESREDTDRQATVTLTSGALSQTVTIIQQKRASIAIAADKTGMGSDAPALAAKMKLGWNLGNSLEAQGGETSWGNPVTTKALIDAVKAAGFQTVRIPCAWSTYFENAATYTIRQSWLARVKEVVDYCVDNGMYAIINIHWDGGWLEENPKFDTQAATLKKEKAIWEQIALYFRDYDEHLLFAGTNEVHKTDYTDPTAENLTVQASFNQTFVNAVRSTGGRNTWRNLIVQAYNTNIDQAVAHLKMPTDPTAGRLMAEIHYYDPYEYTLMEKDESWGTVKYFWGKEGGFDQYGDISGWGQEDYVRDQFGRMKQHFVDKGIPVIMGEYGATFRVVPDTNLQKQVVASRNYYFGYATKTAVANGIIPVYWDNGVTGTNGCGLFDRATGAQVHTEAIKAIVTAK